jgi:adenosylcobyric acid synthase
MPALMIQGCGSDVGKSVLVAGLCRLLTNRGHRVRPFKPQNMSNNAAVTADGGEIGRSTALQAMACRVAPTSDMNPVLLKPQSDIGAQLIVQGQRVGVLDAKDHGRDKRHLLRVAVESYRRLAAESEWTIVEGAGSPAETNLRTHDIANMGFAHAVDLPVVLAGDINRGHVIASLVGAHTVLDAADRARIRGFIVNKFRGDATLFAAGMETIRAHTGWPSLGLVPWLPAAAQLPAEDAVPLEHYSRSNTGADRVKIAVLLLPHIANFDDFDPLQQEPAVDLVYVRPGQPLPLDAHLVVIPGSKTTIADLAFMRSYGWDHDLHAYVRRGGRLLGICAGYQMLGSTIHDPLCIEGPQQSSAGLGLLDIVTIMEPRKVLREVSGVELQTGARIQGYEMHLGTCSGAGGRPMVRFEDGTFDGALSADGRISGCHVHGLFQSTAYRAALLESLGARSALDDHSARVHAALDTIAATLEEVLDVDALLKIGGGSNVVPGHKAPSSTKSSRAQFSPIR